MPTTTVRLWKQSQTFSQESSGIIPVLVNGDDGSRYPSAPALVQDAAGPMSNILVADRYVPWICPASAGTVNLVLDLGSNRSVYAAALVAINGAGTTTNCLIGYKLGNTTPPFYGYDNTFTNFANLNLLGLKRDSAFYTDSPASGRYWRAQFTSTPANVWSISGFLVCGSPDDFGTATYVGLNAVYAPGSYEEPLRPRVLRRSVGGVPLLTRTGRDGRRFGYLWPDANQATRDLVERVVLGQNGDQMLHMTPRNLPYQVFAPETNRLPHIWGTSSGSGDLYDLALELEALP